MFFETLKLILTLLGVLALIYLIWYLAKRFTMVSGNAGRLGRGLSVVERLPLTQDKSLAVVRAGSRLLLLGLSNQRVELITELEPEDWLPSMGSTEGAFPDFSTKSGAGAKAKATPRDHKGGEKLSQHSDTLDSEEGERGATDLQNNLADEVGRVSMKQRDAVWNVSAGAIRGGEFQDGYTCLLDKKPGRWESFLYCLKLALVQHPMLRPFIPKRVRDGVEAQLPRFQRQFRESREAGHFHSLLEDERRRQSRGSRGTDALGEPDENGSEDEEN